ncbi:MAG: SBBP repeat-containing protein, partial [candidate division Zixibacteria bacterium]|nr:SBBP repeat-containing protein [candidate division Zixibacteria bacterium]
MNPKKILVVVMALVVSAFVVSLAPAFAQVDTAWVMPYNEPGINYDIAEAIAVDGSGNVCVTGRSWGSGTEYDYATIKYDSDGNDLWVQRYNGPGNHNDEANAIAIDDSNNVYVTGESGGSETGLDYATIKYYPTGDTAWVRRYNGPGTWNDGTEAIALDGSGNVYVTGWSWGSGTSSDYATIKYYSDGDTAWVRRYNGPGDYEDYAHAIAVDGSGNVYVTGGSNGGWPYPHYDYVSIMYYPNGDTAWVRRYNGPGNSTDHARSIAVDGSGNVYVTGDSKGTGTDYDYTTIKYYPNGDTAWVRRYNGPGNDADRTRSIAVDGSGNVYVTGESWGDGTRYDYATIKYYPNGDTAWVRRYDGPANSDDDALAIAVNDSGNVYVTGGSKGSGTSYDYATIKY